MIRFLNFAFVCIFVVLTTSCSENGNEVEQKTEFELLQYTWKVSSMQIDGTPIPINSGNVDQIRITFNGTNYTYVYPAPPTAPAEQQGTMLTLNGSWRFNEQKTKIYLDRSQISEPEFEWEILQLAPAIFRARYRAINPFDTSTESNYDFSYTIVI